MSWHDVQQGSEDWHSLRLGKVTGSNLACIMANEGKAFGDPAKKYALQLALELETGQRAEYSFSNEHMERGTAQEPLARMLYEEELFAEVTNGGFFDWTTYGDSPDGLVGQDGGVEIKSVVASTHYATLMRGSFDPAYRWQMIGHLECTERPWFDFVSFSSDFPPGRQLIVHRLFKHEVEDELGRLRARRSEFIQLVGKTRERLLEAA